VPQGSVIGPILFLIFINDIQDVVSNSSILIFADDTKIYRTVNNDSDRELLQRDITSVNNWSKKWQLKFNAKKCKVMHLGKSNHTFAYFMEDGVKVEYLMHVDHEKDLGVVVDKELSFDKMMDDKINKANSMMGLIRRTMTFLDQESFKLLFNAFVRPQLEYGNSVWAPYWNKDKERLERVQRRATKQVPGINKLEYVSRLKQLKQPSLEYRRLRGDLIQCYKYVNNLYDAKLNSLDLEESRYNIRGHGKRLKKVRAYDKVRVNFFSNRIVNEWNSLPEHVIEANTLNTFKNRLDVFYGERIYQVIDLTNF
jgi:hypothetical protein